MNKKKYGQFYTTNAEYIINDLVDIIPNDATIVDPFVGNGDLINYIEYKKDKIMDKFLLDIDPKIDNTIVQDTLLNPLDYTNKWIITNPPYLARNKNKDKVLYDMYNLNDYYKIALKTIIGCEGGVIIIPLNFFSDKDRKIRNTFLSKYKIEKLYIFEEQVFDDTSYTVCSFSFTKNENNEQNINTTYFPSKKNTSILIRESNDYLFGDGFFDVINHKNKLKIKRLTDDMKLTPNSNLFLRAIDTGTMDGRISLSVNKNYFYGKNTDRTFATIVLPDEYSNLSLESHEKLCIRFNEILNHHRDKYNSLFLTNFRNSTKAYSRKRIGFDMAYKLISYIIINEKWED